MLSKPLVGTTLSAKLFADNMSDMYLHGAIYVVFGEKTVEAPLSIPCNGSDNKKKKASKSRPLTAVVENTSTRKDIILADWQASPSVTLVALYEIFHVSVRLEQIANALNIS